MAYALGHAIEHKKGLTNMLRKQEAGFSLLEVLIAMLILSIGLLGIAGLQIKGQQYNQSSYLRTQATFLAYDIMDRMRVNILEAGTGNYAPTTWPSSYVDCDAGTCTPAELADYDLIKWEEQVQDNLLRASVQVSWNSTLSEYTIIIQWQSLTESGTQDVQEWKFQP